MIDTHNEHLDLAAGRLGGKVIFATDDFFAAKENLIKPGRGVFIPDKYTDRGKWMDGWESRRKRVPGHDWCVIRLAVPGVISDFDIDTNHFLGNHPPFASVEALYTGRTLAADEDLLNDLKWTEILPKSALAAGSHNLFECRDAHVYSHVRLNIYPDGGVARFRIYGDVHVDWARTTPSQLIDLGSATRGAVAIQCSDMFFSNMSNLTLPDDGQNMGDGWETKRSRTPEHCDWVILRLAHTGIVEKMIVDTAHFKGNFPESCILEGCLYKGDDITSDSVTWTALSDRVLLGADQKHETLCDKAQVVSHVKFTIYPDGGVSRLRLLGKIVTI